VEPVVRLTPRQWQVIELVVEGYTNRQIADRLGISARTAETHLDEIRNRLGVSTRAQIAAWAAGQGARSGSPHASPAGRPATRPALAGGMRGVLTSFIGRADDLRRLRDLVPRSRLLTLWGPGGCGKTRLALQLVSELSPDYEGGTWLVELGRVSRPGLVTYLIAEAMGIREDAGESLTDSIVRRLSAGRALIVLDTCEHLVDEAAEAALTLAGRCAEATVVATSRQPLGVSGEWLYRVRPLGLPAAGGSLGDIGRSEAVQLFTDRARSFVPGFELSAANAADIARVCHSLDGLPLAIELAAADLKVLSVAGLAARIEASRGLLSTGAREWPDRHRTLEAMIGWSYDHLGPQEQVLFRRLAVFRSGFGLPAAEEVCAGAGLSAAQVGPALAELVSRSLVMADEGTCRQLDTIRAFGCLRLSEAGEDDDVFRRLAERCLASHRRESWPDRDRPADGEDVDAELQSALGWCESRDGELGLELAVAAAQRWAWRGYPAQARRWIERMARTVPPSSAQAAKAELEIAKIAFVHGAYDEMSRHIGNAVRAMEGAADPGLLAVAQRLEGLVVYGSGDNAGAIRVFKDAITAARQSGDRWGEAQAHYHAGCALGGAGYLEEAQAHLRHSIAIREDLGQRGRPLMALTVLAMVTLKRGDMASARQILADAIGIARPSGDMRVLACLDVAACIAVASGDPSSAIRLSGASAWLCQRSGLHPQADWTRTVEQTLEPARQSMAAGDLECLLAQGHAMSAEQAIDLAVTLTGVPDRDLPRRP
jgi:non-specific serine/threonine protein kinase